MGEYTYNGTGQRVRKTTSSGITIFHYDQEEELIAESTAAGTFTSEYVFLNSNLFAKIEGDNIYYYFNDHLGTPQKMTDKNGSLVWYGEFLPFGEQLSDTSAITNNFRFPGQYYDTERENSYNYHRDYNPAVGRYFESDTIGIKEGQNHLYAYVNGNPINYADPLGMYKCITRNYTANPNSATIVCNGAGGVTVQMGWCDTAGKCLKKCCKVHENSHKKDCSNKNVCAGKKAGTQVAFANLNDLKKSECKAYKADLKCTIANLKKKECCNEKQDLENNKESDERQIKTMCAN